MIATCHHTVRVIEVEPGLDVCPTCIEEGGTWVHLRQCLVCGKTGCCDSSPNQHASKHAAAEVHEIVTSLEPGEDWSWCYSCEMTLRRNDERVWEEIDTFFETGLWYAQQLVAENEPIPVGPDAATADGFPIGEWVATYQARGRARDIDQDQAAALEELPGWTW